MGVYIGTTELKNAYIGEYIPTSGLLGYRPLQEDLNDVSGNGQNASWLSGTGSFLTLGDYKGARFTRNSSGIPTQYIITPLSYNSVPITILGWGAFSEVVNIQNWTGLFNSGGGGVYGFILGFRGSDGNKTYLSIGASSGSTSTVYKVADTPSINTWYFYAITITSNELKFYVNGVLTSTTSITTPSLGSGTFRLGVGTYDNSRYGGTNGYIRHFAVYNRELTADEILRYYNLTA